MLMDSLLSTAGFTSTGQAEVLYVDYGNTEFKEKDDLKTIKKEYMSLPAQAIQCSLSGRSLVHNIFVLP